MPNEPIICHCDESWLPHFHRNPPYDTEGRNEMLRKRRDQHVPAPRTRMPLFEDEEPDSTSPTPNEESQCGDENQDGTSENDDEKNTETKDRANAERCEDISDLDKDEMIKQQVKSLCDVNCGRKAVVTVGKVNLCEVCLAEFLEDDIPGPPLRFEDVVTPHRPLEDEAL